MINANELRIGNWVKFINKTLQVDGGTIEDCQRANKANSPYQYEPIPLTPEILEKCGFKEKNKDCYQMKNGWWVMFKMDDPVFKDGWWWISDNLTSVHLKSLHQLQNLYFALTGKELEINFTEGTK